jgi:hypothetical protein
MSIGFDPQQPLCLFASEPDAVTVPIDTEGHWLPNRLDLEYSGEVVRVGTPRLLLEGSFFQDPAPSVLWENENGLELQCGIEIKAYSLDGFERTEEDIKNRVKFTTHITSTYQGTLSDFVDMDIKETPTILSAIDRGKQLRCHELNYLNLFLQQFGKIKILPIAWRRNLFATFFWNLSSFEVLPIEITWT